MSLDQLVIRVRGEFTEMPGLRLTVGQAARLWQADRQTCESVLDRLVRERFLDRTRDGAFIRVGTLAPASHARRMTGTAS